ncbi:hypothetical protein GCM10009765_75930 [Fodinicola feengrottensis]|uniref:Regulator of SigK n=1 Tax=Fodinicola feengrottensis TaxID=435914 RepID=A0ABP4V3Y5_9ACTN
MSEWENSVHREYEELAAGWALHALEPTDEARFAAHLPQCAHCQRMVADLGETLSEVAQASPDSEPPPQLRDRIRQAALADLGTSTQVTHRQPTAGPGTSTDRSMSGGRQPADRSTNKRPAAVRPEAVRPADGRPAGRPDRAGRPASRSRRRTLPWVLTAAAVVIALVLGGWNVVLQQQQRARDQVAAQQQDLIRQLVRPGNRLAALSTPAGKPIAYVLSSNGQLEIVTDGMAANAAGRTSYWLWAVPGGPNSAPQPVARFDVTGTGIAVHQLGATAASTSAAAAYAVSIEPGQARPAKPTTVLANGTVNS